MQNLEQRFRFVTWNLQYEGQRRNVAQGGLAGESLSLAQRIEVMAQVMLRLAGEGQPTVFCLQEVDVEMSAELKRQLPDTWRQCAELHGFRQGMGHNAVIVYNSQEFLSCRETSVEESTWTKNENRRWAPLTRLCHRSTGIVCDVISAHLRGFNLQTRQSCENGLAQLALYQKALVNRRTEATLTAQVAFQVIGMDANREAWDALLHERLDADGFCIDQAKERSPTSANVDIGPAALDLVAIAPGATEARVIQVWQHCNPGFELPESYEDLRTPSDHHPSLTEVCVTLERDVELAQALEQLQRAAHLDDRKTIAPFLGYIQERGLTDALRLYLLQQCINEPRSASYLKVAALLGLPQLCNWHPHAKLSKRRQELCTQLLDGSSKKLSCKARVSLILQLDLQQEQIDDAALIKALAVGCSKGWREEWPRDKVADYLTAHSPTAGHKAAWMQVAGQLVELLDPLRQLKLLEAMSDNSDRAPEHANAEAAEWIRQLRLAEEAFIRHRLNYSAHRLVNLRKSLSKKRLYDWACELLASPLPTVLKARILRNVYKLCDTTDTALLRHCQSVVLGLAEDKEEKQSLDLFTLFFVNPESASMASLLEQLCDRIGFKSHDMANCVRTALGKLARSEPGGAERALTMLESLQDKGYACGTESNSALWQLITKALLPKNPSVFQHILRILPKQGLSRKVRRCLEPHFEPSIKSLCSSGKSDEARKLIECAAKLQLEPGPLWQAWLLAASEVSIEERCQVLRKADQASAVLTAWIEAGITPPLGPCRDLLCSTAIEAPTLRKYLSKLDAEEALDLEMELVHSRAEQLCPGQEEWTSLLNRLLTAGQLAKFLASSRAQKSKLPLQPVLTWLTAQEEMAPEDARAATGFCAYQLDKRNPKQDYKNVLKLIRRNPSVLLWNKVHKWCNSKHLTLSIQELHKLGCSALEHTPVSELKQHANLCERLTQALNSYEKEHLELARTPWPLCSGLLGRLIEANCPSSAYRLIAKVPGKVLELGRAESMAFLRNIQATHHRYEQLSEELVFSLGALLCPIYGRWDQLDLAEQEDIISFLEHVANLCWPRGQNIPLAQLLTSGKCLTTWPKTKLQKLAVGRIFVLAKLTLPPACAEFGADIFLHCLDPDELGNLDCEGFAFYLELTLYGHVGAKKLSREQLASLFASAWAHTLESRSPELCQVWMETFLKVCKQGGELGKDLGDAIYQLVLEDLTERADGTGRKPVGKIHEIIAKFSIAGYNITQDLVRSADSLSGLEGLARQLDEATRHLHESTTKLGGALSKLQDKHK